MGFDVVVANGRRRTKDRKTKALDQSIRPRNQVASQIRMMEASRWTMKAQSWISSTLLTLSHNGQRPILINLDQSAIRLKTRSDNEGVLIPLSSDLTYSPIEIWVNE